MRAAAGDRLAERLREVRERLTQAGDLRLEMVDSGRERARTTSAGSQSDSSPSAPVSSARTLARPCLIRGRTVSTGTSRRSAIVRGGSSLKVVRLMNNRPLATDMAERFMFSRAE